MTLCLVTDRRRLAGSGAPWQAQRRQLIAQVRGAVHARVNLIQVRERDLSAADLVVLVDELLGVTRGSATRVVVNDRLDVSLACGADGVHLRGDSMSPAAARRLAPRGFLVGRSVHGVDEVHFAAGADYLIAGAVYPTGSKPASTSWLGVDGLAAIVRAADVPVLAIGGMNLDRLEEVAGTGAAGVAAIGLFHAAVDPADPGHAAPVTLADLVHRMRQRFDSTKTAP